MERDINKKGNTSNPDYVRKWSNPVQYFTFGKDNCLVHHPTSQNKNSSSSAIFCRTNPFQTQADKISHRKVKSTLPMPHTQVRHTPHSNKYQQLAISKLAKKLKQANASCYPNSDFPSMIIEGKSIKLNPKNYDDQSACDTATYYKRIKRCKICGKFMLGLDPPSTSSDSCSDCKPDKVGSSVDVARKITKVSCEHNPKLKRCVICSELFIRNYDSSFCGNCLSNARFKAHENGASRNMTATSNKQDSSSKTLPKNIVSTISIDSKTNEHTTWKASQGVKSSNLPANSSDDVDKLTQPDTLISEHSKKKANIACKKTSDAKSHTPTQTNSILETNQLYTKSKFPTKKTTLESCFSQEQFKNANMTSKKASVKKSNINSIAESLTEANRVSVRSKNSTEELSSENHPNRELGNMNTSTTKTSSKIPNKLSQSRSVPETNQTVLKSRSTVKEFAAKSSLESKDVNENKKTSNEMSNVPTQTHSLFETNQLSTNVMNTSGEFISEICIDIEECPSANMSDKMVSTENSNRHIQSKSLIETGISSTETIAKEQCTQEIYIDRQEFPNTSKSVFTEASTMPAQTKSLSETKRTATKSTQSSEKFTSECLKPNMANKSTSTDKLKTDTQTESLSQQEQDFLSKYAHLLCKEINNTAKERPTSPILQNVTVNNNYFLMGSDLKNVLCNSAVACNFSPAKRTSSESVSLVSEDEAREKHNEAHINPKNSTNSLLESELTNSVLEQLYGAFEHNADVLLPSSCQSQFDVSLYSDPCSTLESGHFQSSIMSNNLYRDILKEEMPFKNFNLSVNERYQTHSQDAQCLYGIKSMNPYTCKSLMLLEEMDRVRNERIDHGKILEVLKKNKILMKGINQMAAKKLNFPRKSTVFKNSTSM